MYVLAKFQLYILKAYEVTALQSNSNRKIDLYSKHRENKLQVLPKTNVTYTAKTNAYYKVLCFQNTLHVTEIICSIHHLR